MSDQPKPNQPASPPPVQSPQPPKDEQPAADQAPVSPAASSEAKPTPPAEAKPDAAAKPNPDVPPASPAKPADSAPAQPAQGSPAPAAPTVPTSGTPAQPPPAAPTVPNSSTPAQPPPAAPTVPTTSTPAASSASGSPAQPAAPTVPTSGTPAAPPPAANRDISDDPTLPAKPASTTVPVAPPAGAKDDTIPPLSGSSKVTQRFNEPSPAGQAAAGTICPSCGHRNRPGTLICDNCGTNLVGGIKSAVGTRDLVSATEAASATSTPLMNEAEQSAVESAGGSTFTDEMVLRIEIEGGATPMLVYPKQEIILGRRDPNTGTLPDVDMTAYSGYRMGVSRTHASIRLQDKQLNLSDRGSSNGTFLNGTRLVAHRPYPLKDGDEIRLGQMVLKIYFQSNKNRK